MLSRYRSGASASPLTIASGQTASSAFSGGGSALSVIMPAALTGTAITFQVSADNATFTPLYDATNVLVSITVAASRAYPLPASLASFPYWKIVSGTAEGAARTLLVCRES